MTWASLTLLPLVHRLPGLDVLGVPPADHRRRDTRLHRTVEAPVLKRTQRSPVDRGCGALGGDAPLPDRDGCCGVVIVRLHDRVGGRAGRHRRVRHHRPGHPQRSLGAWPLSILLALWVIRALAHWLQARLVPARRDRGDRRPVRPGAAHGDRAATASAGRRSATTPRSSSPADSTACGRTSPPTCPRCSWPASSPRPRSW